MANPRTRWMLNNTDMHSEAQVRQSLKRRPIGSSVRAYCPSAQGMKERTKLMLLECGFSYGIEDDGAFLAVRILPAVGDMEKLYHALDAVYGGEGSVHAMLIERAAEYAKPAQDDEDDAPVTVDEEDDFAPSGDL